MFRPLVFITVQSGFPRTRRKVFDVFLRLFIKRCVALIKPIFSCCFFSYAVVLNGYESIMQALQNKSSHFAHRPQSLVTLIMNKDLPGLTFGLMSSLRLLPFS